MQSVIIGSGVSPAAGLKSGLFNRRRNWWWLGSL